MAGVKMSTSSRRLKYHSVGVQSTKNNEGDWKKKLPSTIGHLPLVQSFFGILSTICWTVNWPIFAFFPVASAFSKANFFKREHVYWNVPKQFVLSFTKQKSLLIFIIFLCLLQDVTPFEMPGTGTDDKKDDKKDEKGTGQAFPQPIPVPLPGPIVVPVVNPVPVPAPGSLAIPVPMPSPVQAPGPIPLPLPLPVVMPAPGPVAIPVVAPMAMPAPGPVPIPIPAPMPLPIPMPGPPAPPAPIPVEKEITSGIIAFVTMVAVSGLIFFACCLAALAALVAYLCERADEPEERDLEAYEKPYINREESSSEEPESPEEDSNSDELENGTKIKLRLRSPTSKSKKKKNSKESSGKSQRTISIKGGKRIAIQRGGTKQKEKSKVHSKSKTAVTFSPGRGKKKTSKNRGTIVYYAGRDKKKTAIAYPVRRSKKKTSRNRGTGIELKIGSPYTRSGDIWRSIGRKAIDAGDAKKQRDNAEKNELQKKHGKNSHRKKVKLPGDKTSDTTTSEQGKGQLGAKGDGDYGRQRDDREKDRRGSGDDVDGKNRATKTKQADKVTRKTKEDDKKTESKLPVTDSKTSDTKTAAAGKGQQKGRQIEDKDGLLRGGSHPNGDRQKPTGTADRRTNKNVAGDGNQRKGDEQLEKEFRDKMGKSKPATSGGKSTTDGRTSSSDGNATNGKTPNSGGKTTSDEITSTANPVAAGSKISGPDDKKVLAVVDNRDKEDADGKMPMSGGKTTGKTATDDRKTSSTDEKTTSDGRTSTDDGKTSTVDRRTSSSGGKTSSAEGGTSTVSPLHAGSKPSENDGKKAAGTVGLDSKKGKKDVDLGKPQRAGGQPPLDKDNQSKPSDKAGGHGKDHQVDDRDKISRSKPIIPAILGGSGSRKKKIEGKDSKDAKIQEQQKDGKAVGPKDSVDTRDIIGKKPSTTKEMEGKLEGRQKMAEVMTGDRAGGHGKGEKLDDKLSKDKINKSKPPPTSEPSVSPSSGTSKENMEGKDPQDKNQRRKDGKNTENDAAAQENMARSKPSDKNGKTGQSKPATPTEPSVSPSSGTSKDKIEKKGTLDKDQRRDEKAAKPKDGEKTGQTTTEDKADGKTAGSTDGSQKKTDQSKPRPPSLLYSTPSPGGKKEKVGKDGSQEKMPAEKPRPPAVPFAAPSAGPSREKLAAKERKSAEKPRPPPLPYGAPNFDGNKEKVTPKGSQEKLSSDDSDSEEELSKEKLSAEKVDNTKPLPPSLPFVAASQSKEKVGKKKTPEKVSAEKPHPPDLPYTPPSAGPGKEKVDKKEKVGNSKPQLLDLPNGSPGGKKTEKLPQEKISPPRPPNLPHAAPSPGSSKGKSDEKKTPEKISADKPRPPDVPYTAPSPADKERSGEKEAQKKIGNLKPPDLPYKGPGLAEKTPKKPAAQEKASPPRPPNLPYKAPSSAAQNEDKK